MKINTTTWWAKILWMEQILHFFSSNFYVMYRSENGACQDLSWLLEYQNILLKFFDGFQTLVFKMQIFEDEGRWRLLNSQIVISFCLSTTHCGFGVKTWSLTESQKSRLKVCQRAMDRSNAARKYKIWFETLRCFQNGHKSCQSKNVARQKWDWAGHVWTVCAVTAGQNMPGNGWRRLRKRCRDDLDVRKRARLEVTWEKRNWGRPLSNSGTV